MEQKPLHYDGSFHLGQAEESAMNGTFVMTDEMRVNVGKNPYSLYSDE